MFRKYLIVCLLLVGCVEPYKPGTNVDKPVAPIVSPVVAFDTYKKDVAANFRQLAQDCMNGSYEYVSELVDASVKLDTKAKIKRSKPIDAIFSKELGNDKLDKDKAATLLNKIADELDPSGKVALPVKTTSLSNDTNNDRIVSTDRIISNAKPIDNRIIAQAAKEVTVTIIRNPYYSSDELMSLCRTGVQEYGVMHTTYRDHLINEHHFLPGQVDRLNHRQCKLLHENVHAGFVKPTRD